MPSHILYKVKPKNIKRYLVCWRGIWKLEARRIQIDELTEPFFDKDKANGTDKKHGLDNRARLVPARTATLIERRSLLSEKRAIRKEDA